MNIEEIKELFIQGIDCSQVVAEHYSEKLGLEPETARKVSACFGGGMQCGETCGAVTGALMVIGLRYGHTEEGDENQKQIMREKIQEFKMHFNKKYSSCICNQLLGYDLTNPKEFKIIMEKELFLNFCPKVVQDTIEILEMIL